MADYKLEGLNPRDFQHFVQALAKYEISPAVVPFGDGTDGARDLVCHGRMIYPNREQPWDGYLVVGCKFRQRTDDSSLSDSDWAYQQLKADLDKYLDKERKLQRPEFFLFVTNVRLSGVPSKGGHDRIRTLLQTYKRRIRWKASDYWDYRKLCTLLDAHEDIRKAYGHFVTAGDVLAQMMAWLNWQQADFEHVMDAFLQKQLLADRSAKLQSTSDDPKARIPLANVFVDLPAHESAAALIQDTSDSPVPGVIRYLLDAASCVLRRVTTATQTRDTKDTESPVSRFVLVGGPGQGKSTLGQYLCQLYRAAILAGRPPERLVEEVPRAIEDLRGQQLSEGLPLARRFPLRVELKTFSNVLVDKPDMTLLQFLADEISKRGGADRIRLAQLKEWLSAYPWLLVLDGLDEVPPSGNRPAVLRAIEEFRVDAATVNADLLIVATTRPQSYANDFSPELFCHLYLTPLSQQKASEYSRRLIAARHEYDDARQEELIQRLDEACQNPVTARLMRSPLQVTIMATLLEQKGKPPQQRYLLFEEYYRTIYDRERARDILAMGDILNERQAVIDKLHWDTGLLLQATAEKPASDATMHHDGAHQTSLTDSQFTKLARRTLAHNGDTGPEAALLLRRIADTTLQRLVFLVRREEGHVEFDMQSLQEFMAAKALMKGPDRILIDRLRATSPASYWRNVTLFAVGQCFAERDYLLDNVHSICSDLNVAESAASLLEDRLAAVAAHATLWGSRLALDILVDGTTRQYPNYEVRFLKPALELVSLPDATAAARLADVYTDRQAGLYQDAIRGRFDHANFWHQRGAWLLLMNLADKGIQWALEWIDRHWPEHEDHQCSLLLDRENNPWKPWAIDRVEVLVPVLSESDLNRLSAEWEEMEASISFEEHSWLQAAKYLGALRRGVKDPSLAIQLNGSMRIVWENIYLSSIQEHESTPLDNLLHDTRARGRLAVYLAARRFARNPTAESLAQELDWLADHWTEGLRFFVGLPWPLSSCLQWCCSKDDMKRLAQQVAAGELGSTDIWIEAERRWREHGINDADLVYDDKKIGPFTKNIAAFGCPLDFNHLGRTTSTKDFWDESYQKALQFCRCLEPRLRSSFVNVMVEDLCEAPSSQQAESPPATLRELISWELEVHGNGWLSVDLLNGVLPETLTKPWLDFLIWLGSYAVHFYNPHRDAQDTNIAYQLARALSASPKSRIGLIRILAYIARNRVKGPVSRAVLLECRGLDSRFEADIAILRLSSDEWIEQDIRELAQAIISSDSLVETVADAFKVIPETVPTEQVTKFAVALLAALSPMEANQPHTKATEIVLGYLIGLLHQRPSRLTEQSVWQNLQLPEPLPQ